MRTRNPYVTQAEENGINRYTYYARVDRGWSKERASTEPTNKQKDVDDEIIRKAERKGIPLTNLRHRLRTGWSVKDAINTPLGKRRKIKRNQIAVYKGGVKLCQGTSDECAEYLGCKPSTIDWLTTPAYHRRAMKSKRMRIAFKVGESNES